MTDHLEEKINFRLAIDDPYYFIGRGDLLENILQNPLDVWILLGGRRIGKTSFLNALEWNFLDQNSTISNRVFPVLIDLNLAQPKNLENLRYLIVVYLRKAIERWKQVKYTSLREAYRSYLKQIVDAQVTLGFLKTFNIRFNIANSDYERQLDDEDFRQACLKSIEELQKQNFSGICLLLDGSEYIACQEWGINVWKYFRSLIDAKNSLKPYLGIVLSGYRELKDRQKAAGSPLLNIAHTKWFSPFNDLDALKLINLRKEDEKIPLTDKAVSSLLEWSGCHPYLINSMLDCISIKIRNQESLSLKEILNEIIYQHSGIFTSWWNEDQEFGRLGTDERIVYHALIECRKGHIHSLAQNTRLGTRQIKDILNVLTATGIVRQINRQEYVIGSRMFEEWVKQR